MILLICPFPLDGKYEPSGSRWLHLSSIALLFLLVLLGQLAHGIQLEGAARDLCDGAQDANNGRATVFQVS